MMRQVATAMVGVLSVWAVSTNVQAATIADIDFEGSPYVNGSAIEFKSDAFGTWSESGGTRFIVQNTNARDGSQSVQFGSSGSGFGIADYTFDTAATDIVTMTFSMYRDTQGADGDVRFAAKSGGSVLFEMVLVGNSGDIRLAHGDGAGSETSTILNNVTAVSQWYDFEVVLDMATDTIVSAKYAQAGNALADVITSAEEFINDVDVSSVTGLRLNANFVPDADNAWDEITVTSEVPEPATLGLLACGAVMMWRRK